MGCLFVYCEFLAFYIKAPFRAPSQIFFQTQQNKRGKAGHISLPRSPGSLLPTAARFHTALPVPCPAPSSSQQGRRAGGSDSGQGPGSAPGASRQGSPPARPGPALPSAPARAAAGPGHRGNRTPTAGGRGHHRYRPRHAPLGPITAQETEQGRGFSAHAQQRSWRGWAAMLRCGGSVAGRAGGDSYTGRLKSYTVGPVHCFYASLRLAVGTASSESPF